jgi:DNA invertase Pin-like site-specific DNA recombinase
MRAVIYLHVFKGDDIQRTADQFDRLCNYVKSQKWQLVHTYRDALTGKKKDRTAYQQMLAGAAQHKFDVLVFWSLDRLSREGIMPTITLLQKLTTWDIGYRSFTEPHLDSLGPHHETLIELLTTLGKQDKVRSESTRIGLKRMRANNQPGPKGFYAPGRPPAQVNLKKAKQLRAKGLSYEKIAALCGTSKATLYRSLNSPDEIARKPKRVAPERNHPL